MSGLTIKDRTRHGCLEAQPNPNTVWFDGIPLNLSAISRSSGINLSYLSRILSGEREVSIAQYRKIIKALSSVRTYTLDQLLEMIADRKADLLRMNSRKNGKNKKG